MNSKPKHKESAAVGGAEPAGAMTLPAEHAPERLSGNNEAQVWIERVGKDGHCSVVIEDGEIESAPAITETLY